VVDVRAAPIVVPPPKAANSTMGSVVDEFV